ncbi:MAG: uridine kinase, partial [Nakamurella sp.]
RVDGVRFTPLTPERLVNDLAEWILALPLEHPRVGIDGATEIGAGTLADAVGARLIQVGRPVLRASTDWWWRPASLRLELGRTDIDMLLGGWVDAAALRRELLDPLEPGGSASCLLRLRDPSTDRSVRDSRLAAPPRAALLLDGPLLLGDQLPLDAVLHLQTTRATLARALPARRQWWLQGFDRYLAEYRPADSAAAVVAYDHPKAPAIAWAAQD